MRLQKHPVGRLTRRDVVKAAGVAGVAAAGASLGFLGGKAPAYAQSRQLHMVQWSHFIPPADELLAKHAAEFESQTGVSVRMEHINQNDLNARATAAVESGTGFDIIELRYNQPHLYATGFADVGDVVEDVGGDDIYQFALDAVNVEGVYRGVPLASIGNIYCYREDVYRELGIDIAGRDFNMDEFLNAGRKLKEYGMPVGFTLGHTLGDAPVNTYTIMWTFGAQEVDEDQNVVINSQEMRNCLDWFRTFWNEACDTSALAWDDSANNRAFLSEQTALTKNASSIYFFAKHNPDRAPEGLAENTNHHLGPVGPAGRFHILAPNSRCILRNSPNVDAAKDFLRFMMEPERYDEWILVQEGFSTPHLPKYEDHPMWTEDPKLEAFAEIAAYGRNFGHAGPFNRKASEAQVKFIVVDIFARVARGDSTDEAIAWGEKELKLVYEA